MTQIFASFFQLVSICLNHHLFYSMPLITICFCVFFLLDSNKNTPLFHAAEGGHLTCCALLVVSFI